MAYSFWQIFLLFLLVLLFTNSQSSTDERKEKNKEIETEIRKLFHEHKIFVNYPLRDNELLCKCNNHEGCSGEITEIVGNKFEGICRTHRHGQCRRMVNYAPDGKISEIVLSCVHREELVPSERPFICQSVNNTRVTQVVKCCKTESFCNEDELPIESEDLTRSLEAPTDDSIPWYNLLLMLLVAVIFSGFGLCIGIFYCNARRISRVKTNFDRCVDRVLSVRTISNQQVRFRQSSRLDKLLDDLERTVSTGSGAGLPLLAQRTIARQITLKECIGRGRFGEVYVGEWRGEKVAVKIFLSRDEPSWQRETDIYRHNMVRHSNLLRWIASDNKDTGTSTQLWLVTEFLPNGSLFDFLEDKNNLVGLKEALQFIRSIAHGLAYLHTEVPGVNNQCHKPGIAHRDIKSKNILIKNDMTCCIADLGMAIRYINGEVDIPRQDRGGTVRYLAPEFLTGTFNHDSFTSYLQMDIYAFALVIWEICRRADAPGEGIHALPYEIPYQEFVPREPMPADMFQCVCVEGRRPSIRQEWRASKTLAELVRIMSESWSGSPNSRLTALNIRCALDRICSEQNLQIIT